MRTEYCAAIDPSDQSKLSPCLRDNCPGAVNGDAAHAMPVDAIMRAACADACVASSAQDGGRDDAGH